MLYLGSFFYISLLLINAMAILNEERFLRRIGWGSQPQTQSFYQQQSFDPYSGTAGGTPQQDISIKSKLVNLISAVRTLMRVPLIFVNVGVIVYEIILGG